MFGINNKSNFLFTTIITIINVISGFIFFSLCVIRYQYLDLVEWPFQSIINISNCNLQNSSISTLEKLNYSYLEKIFSELQCTKITFYTRSLNEYFHSFLIKSDTNIFEDLKEILNEDNLLIDSFDYFMGEGLFLFYFIIIIFCLILISSIIITIVYSMYYLDLIKLLMTNGVHYKYPLNFVYNKINLNIIYSSIISFLITSSCLYSSYLLAYEFEILQVILDIIYNYHDLLFFIFILFVFYCLKTITDIIILNIIVFMFKKNIKEIK